MTLDEILRDLGSTQPTGKLLELICAAGRMSDALRWLSTVVVGPGGYPRDVVQRVASVAAKGGHWQLVLDDYDARRRQLLRGQPSGGRNRR